MPRPNQGLTKAFRLRITEQEDHFVAEFMKRCAVAGVKISQNDAVRVLIRFGSLPPFSSEAAGRRAIERHWELCPACTSDALPACPDGLLLMDRYAAVNHASQAAVPTAPTAPRPSNRLLPPPPGTIRQPTG
jgi:hypothetical protein